MNLLIVTTSVRKGRSGEKVTNWFVDQVEKDGRFTPDVVDLKELNCQKNWLDLYKIVNTITKKMLSGLSM